MNVYLNRVSNQVGAHAISVSSYLIDLGAVTMISLLLGTDLFGEHSKNFLILSAIGIFILRLFFVNFLRENAYRKFYKYKELKNVEAVSTLMLKIRANSIDDEAIERQREVFLGSSEICVVNFDIPISLLVGEGIVMIGAVIFLIWLGLFDGLDYSFAFFFPIFLGYYIVVKKIKSIGRRQLINQEVKILTVTNIFSGWMNYLLNRTEAYITRRYLIEAGGFNENTVNFMILNIMGAQMVELMIVIGTIIVLSSTADIDDLVVLGPFVARVVPSISKVLAYITQLTYGMAAVKKNG